MKFLFVVLILLIVACSSVKKNSKVEIPEELKNYPTLTVTKIENKKDGYTAHLIDEGKMTYTMYVSKINLKDNFLTLKVEDIIKAEGDYAESIPVIIYVKRIFKLN